MSSEVILLSLLFVSFGTNLYAIYWLWDASKDLRELGEMYRKLREGETDQRSISYKGDHEEGR